MPTDEDYEPEVPEDLGERLFKEPRFLTRDELHARALEQWGRVADKMRAMGKSLETLGDAVRETTKAMDMVGNEFDALGPILDELEEDDEEEDGGEEVIA